MEQRVDTTEVGIQWVFMGLWAVWLEQKEDFFRGRVTTFLCLSPLGSLRVRPHLFLFVFTVLAQGGTLLSVLSNE